MLPYNLVRYHNRLTVNLIRNLTTKVPDNSNINRYTRRTHTCGQLTKRELGKDVTLYGWVQYTRFGSKFIVLRDSYGVTQCILDKDLQSEYLKGKSIPIESVIRIAGTVRARPENQINLAQTTGDIEVAVKDIEIINEVKKDLPILTRNVGPDKTPTNRLKHRYLDIRSNRMQEALRFRSRIYQIFRQHLSRNGFVECETPTLFARTPGGANEFIVPTQAEHKFFSLTQSPQQLKQLLMVGGLDRYFQICRCYRDEPGRADRQPEFTQLDIELSFTSQAQIIKLIEDLMYELLADICNDLEEKVDLQTIFQSDKTLPQMSYDEAMSLYGSDKPDTRFDWTIEATNKNKLTINIPHTVDESLFHKSLKWLRADKKIALSDYSITSDIIEGDKTSISIDCNQLEGYKILGLLRVYIAAELDNQGKHVYKAPYKLTWITDFPLFNRSGVNGSIEPTHHPFTAPNPETTHLVGTDPLRVVGQHYDLVMNGQEIAGGSIRIHDANLQTVVLRDVLRLDESMFSYFIDALKSGCPPHGGIAIGVDRLIALLLKRDSIKEVIAFPKSSTGRDLMSDSPQEIDGMTRRIYGLS